MFIPRRQSRARNPRNSSNGYSHRPRTLTHRQRLLGRTIPRNTPTSSNNLSHARRTRHTGTSASWHSSRGSNSTRRASSRARCARHTLTLIHLA
jgi:hypothetical protein